MVAGGILDLSFWPHLCQQQMYLCQVFIMQIVIDHTRPKIPRLLQFEGGCPHDYPPSWNWYFGHMSIGNEGICLKFGLWIDTGHIRASKDAE